MKKLVIASLLSAGSFIAFAQQPSPDPDTLKNPIKQIDPEPKQQPADIQYVDERERIAADELPQPVLQSLQELEPSGWEKSVVYRDKQHSVFIIEMRDNEQEKIYRFDREGRRLKNLDDKKGKNRKRNN
ncbi:hypothetical protein [Chryseosolibacter indicus]|uniref:PepSY domain-containing protein n=1 Tax=Chryseosolibacter indicus TaxID=2782351 RepID=A0ABS5VQ11_9BACT|nr:hypothetical protein [Chryseosolibacter indicus]MBT1703527.1 hypothetical protein [Chryseosolibacter indicus]